MYRRSNACLICLHFISIFDVYTCKGKSTLRNGRSLPGGGGGGGGRGAKDTDRGGKRRKKYRTAIVSVDLDRTDNRFHGSDVLKGFHWFTYRAVRWATSKWNL